LESLSVLTSKTLVAENRKLLSSMTIDKMAMNSRNCDYTLCLDSDLSKLETQVAEEGYTCTIEDEKLCHKATIMKRVSERRIDIAVELYQKNQSLLVEVDRIDIYNCLFSIYDTDVVLMYFPDILVPSGDQFESNEINSFNVNELNSLDVLIEDEEDSTNYNGPCFQLKVHSAAKLDFWNQLQSYCQSHKFRMFVSHWGIQTPVFVANPLTRHGNYLFERFSAEYLKLPQESKIQIVFYSTKEENISNILRDGLDPNQRSIQSYGPGDYFGKNPLASARYGHPGNSMLVFAIVVPDRHENVIRCPDDIIVVHRNEHQLPLGTISFTSIDTTIPSKSRAMKARLAELSAEVREQQKQAEIGTIYAKIIQDIIMSRVYNAADLYRQYHTTLSETQRRVIAMYAYQKFERRFVTFFFPDMAANPMTYDEHDTGEQCNVDILRSDARRMERELEEFPFH
jgi:hypothetical protein